MNNIIAMIPAAGRGSRMLSLTEDNPKALLPLHNKTIIDLHLDKCIKEGIIDVCIIVGYKKEKLIEHVNKLYSNKLNIIFAEQKLLKGLAHALYYGIEEISNKYDINKYNLLIMLGDTIIKDKLPKNKYSWIGYSEVEDYQRWCLMETNNDIITSFIDKPDKRPNTNKAVIGIYYFNNIGYLKDCITNIIINDIKIKDEYQLSSAMELYMKKYNLYAKKFNDWYDCGEFETFIKSKKNLTRYFNDVKITDDNTIIKSSKDINKINNEINWYLNLPRKLLIYTPQLIDYNNNSYELEYINFNHLQDLFLYNLPNMNDWHDIFDKIFNMINKFKNYSSNNFDKYYIMEKNKKIFQDKLFERLNKYDKKIKQLFDKNLIINDVEYLPFNFLKQKLILELVNIINNINYYQIIHGDLFFGNMFFDINSQTLKIIDPRGSFGELNNESNEEKIYGDIRYDLAKLNHSIKGKYDFIINNLYTFEIKDFDKNKFNYIIYDNKSHNEINKLFDEFLIKEGYNTKEISLITATLFLSMVPLHSENFNNMLLMYLIGIQLLNKAILEV